MAKSKKFLILEIEDNFIKGALIEKIKDSIFIRDITSFPKDKKELTTAIKRLHLYSRYRKNTIVLIPPKKVMVRYLNLPSRNRGELKDMIDFQLPRYLPYNFGDIIFDFKIVQETKEGYSKVMIACIQKSFFNEFLALIPHLEESFHGVFICGETGVNLLQTDKATALLDISSEEVILSVFDSSGILFMRSLNTFFFIHERDWNKGIEELEKTFIAFGREFNEIKADSITVTGAKSYALSFYNFLKEHSRRNIELFNPFDHVQYQKDIVEKFNNLSFQAIIGAGAGTKKKHINLIPKEVLSRKEKRAKKRNTIHILLLTIVIVFQLSFIIYKEIDKKKVYLNFLKFQISKTAPKARVIEDKEKKTSLIKAQIDMEGSSLDILREIYTIIPKDISINILIFEKNKSLGIRGTARTMADVFSLIPCLEKSPYFFRVISEGTKMRRIKGDVVADFQIRAMLKK